MTTATAPAYQAQTWHGQQHVMRQPADPVVPGSPLAFPCGCNGKASAADVRATGHGDYPWCVACRAEANKAGMP